MGFSRLVALLALCCTCSKPVEPPVAPTLEEVAAPAAQPATATPNDSLVGTYLDSHMIGAVCDSSEMCEETVTDTLRIQSDDETKTISVEVELVQANFHTCTFENTLRTIGPRRWKFSESTPDSNCHVSLSRDDKSVTITSQGCREYCGARASLDAEFSFPPEDVDPTAFDCKRRCLELSSCKTDDATSKTAGESCASSCYGMQKLAQRRFDLCVRKSSGDCGAVRSCKMDAK